MKILIDLTSLADNFSGIERYAACLAVEMIEYSDNKYILLFKNEIHPMFLNYKRNNNIKMIIISGFNKLIFNQVKLPLAVYKHNADAYLFLAFPVPILLFKKNMISTIHDICCWDCPDTMNGLSKWYFRLSHRIAIKKCKTIITISEFSKKRIVEKLNYPENNIWLIYCGVDKNFIGYQRGMDNKERLSEKYHIPKEYILTLSTLEPRKNLKILLNAYCELAKHQKIALPLVLGGRKGWKLDSLLEGIDKEVKKKIFFTGFVDDTDLPVLYGNASFFVFPSMYEGFGMPPLEAMSCGALVLSSDSTSLPEVLGDAAVYFNNLDVEDLKAKLLEISSLTDSERKKYEQVARCQSAIFNWSKEARKLLDNLEHNLFYIQRK